MVTHGIAQLERRGYYYENKGEMTFSGYLKVLFVALMFYVLDGSLLKQLREKVVFKTSAES